MSFQAYLDTIEEKTGLTPRQLIELAAQKGLVGPSVKAGEIIAWLKTDYGLGRGHAMAIVHVIKHGDKIDAKHVGSTRIVPAAAAGKLTERWRRLRHCQRSSSRLPVGSRSCSTAASGAGRMC